jgi:hypothetical protein
MAFGALVQDIIFRISTQFVGPKDAVVKLTDQIGKVGGRVKNFGTALDATKPKMASFRFDMLSLMFMGQMVQKTLSGLLQPAFEAAGIFDIWGAMLEIFFLPIAMVLLDFLLWLFDIFTAMPESVQLVIGAFVLIGSIIAGVIGFLAAMGVGISSIFGGFAAFATWLGGFAGVIAGVISFVASLPAAVVAAIALLLLAIIFNWEGFLNAFIDFFQNTIDSIAQMIRGVVKIFQGVIDILIGIVTLNKEKIIGGFQKIGQGILDFFVATFRILIGNFAQFGWDMIVAFATGITRAGGYIVNALRGLPIIGPFIGAIGDIAGGISNAITGAVGGLVNWIGGLIPHFQHGGIVTGPTLAMVGEAGPEAIVPAGSSGLGTSYFYNPITINANIASGIDIADLADEINDRLATDYRRRQMVRMRQV